MRDPAGAILRYNRRFRGRYPHLLKRKIALMSESPFLFFRGTFHLFAADWVAGRFDAWPSDSPLRERDIRIVADVHSENFGAYGVDHHHAAYGINDFDDTTTGRLDFDACRAAASVLLAAWRRGLQVRSAAAAAEAFAEAYVGVLGGGDRPADAAPIAKLLDAAEHARRPEFIRGRTVLVQGRRRFRGPRFFPLKPNHRAQALRLFADYLGRRPRRDRRDPSFFEVEDVCGRTAGCGSLGRLRYVVLVRGEGSKEARNAILELKESLVSALDDARGRAQPRSRSRAGDVVAAMRAFQEQSDPFLGFAVDGASSFQVRQLGPRDARLDGDALAAGHLFRETASSYGAELAAAHRRANRGVVAPLLREATGGHPEAFLRRTLSFALAYAQQAEEDWRVFLKHRARVAADLL